MGKNDRVHVFLRVRPNRDRRGPDDEGYHIEHSFEKSKIQFHVDKKQRDDDVVNHSVEDYRFEFDRVFGPKTTQEEMFNMVAKDCVLSALDGYNSTIFAYGQTGSGKTYSITGGTESYNDRGIIPRTLSMVFDECAKRTDYEWTVRISYLQIYNDKGQDLLNRGKDAKTLDELPQVTVHETDDEVILKGLEAHQSSSIHDALNLLFLGDTNRLYCETPMNKTSSRSHCIFTISIESRGHGTATVRRSKLNLVDLAGSERVGKTGVQGNLLTEAKYINLSLHYLEHVIVALSEQSKGVREHIPYRNSFMTMCLRDSLGGNCRTAMLATAHPAPEYFMETISTCKFAQRVACIKQDARVNEETDPTVLVRKLKAQVAQLSEQLAFYKKGDQNADRKMDGDEYERCREVVQRFIDDPDPNSNISGINGDLARIMACFKIMKGMLGGKVSIVPGWDGKSASNPTPQPPPGSSAGGRGQTPPTSAEAAKLKAHVDALTISLQQKENEISLLFNIVEKSSAPKFNAETQTGDPTAPSNGNSRNASFAPNADPSSLAGLLQQRQQQQQQPVEAAAPQQQVQPLLSAAELATQDERMKSNYDLTALADADLLKDRQAAFEAFRRSYRKYEQIEKNKMDLKSKYDECKQIAMEVNSCVDQIKQLKFRVNQLRADRALQGLAEPHADEQQAMAQLSAVKQHYQEKGGELGKKKEYIDHMHLVIMRAQEQLTKDFDDWFTSRLKQLQIAQQQQARLAAASGATPAGSGSRAVAAMQQMEFGGNMIPSTSSRVAQPSTMMGNSNTLSQQQQSLASTMGSGGGASARFAPNNNSSLFNPTAYQAPSSAPSMVGGGNVSVGGRVPATGSGVGGRQPSPPPPTQQSNNYMGGSSSSSSGGGGFERQRGPSSGNFFQQAQLHQQQLNGGGTSSNAFARSVSGATFAEAQHADHLQQHSQHARQMQTINNTSHNSMAAGMGVGVGGALNRMGGSTAASSVYTSSAYGGASSSQPPSSSGASAPPGMNPYCPQYPSTGDPIADQQLAAMYKARDEMRARLQQGK